MANYVKAPQEIIDLLKKAYWMEIETVMSYVANSINPDGVRAQVFVLSPALNSKLRHWVSDDDAARIEAQSRLDESLYAMRAAGIEARGQIGDSDPLQAMADDEVVVELADGTATLGGEEAAWRTTGVYRIAGGRIAEAWLVPLDLAAFDAAWSR